MAGWPERLGAPVRRLGSMVMETVAPSTMSYPKFQPRMIKFRVEKQHQRDLGEVIITKTDKIKDGVAVQFPECSYPTERYLVEQVGQLQDATLLKIPRLQRRFLVLEGLMGQVCPTTEELRKQLLEHIGQLLLEWCVGAKLLPAPQAEAQMQYIAEMILSRAQQEGFSEFERAKLRVQAVWTQPWKFQIHLWADFQPFMGMDRQRVMWGGDLSVPAIPHYDPREGSPEHEALYPDPRPAEPKPSPFVDHKPYWKLPP